MSDSALQDRVVAGLSGSATLVVRSPGRINLIGEHTDYTGGLVLPASIDKSLYFALRPIDGRELRLSALDLKETATLSLPVAGRTGTLWVDYLAGIVDQFQQLGHDVPGLEIAFGGNLPRGAGVSSSAALEGGMAFLLNELTGAGLSRPEMAALCKRSSNRFLGIPSGIMDQFASLNGSAAGPLRLDCATLEHTLVDSRIAGYDWLLVNSNVSHDLSDGAYGKRVAACQRALEAIQSKYPNVSHLSHASQQQLEEVADQLDAVARRRADYVIRENERVDRMVDALGRGAAAEAGALLNATHAGLRDDYEVSCPEVDFLQEQATRQFEGEVAGARIMGGGFGGCTINLVRSADIPALQRFLTTAYQKTYGRTPDFYPVRLANGTEIVTP